MKRYLYTMLFVLGVVVLPTIALAQQGGTGNSIGGTGNSNCNGASCSYEVKNPLAANSFCGLVKALLKAAIQIGIPIAVLFIVFAGFKFVLAQGKPDALAAARKNLLWTLIGIGIFLGAWLLANVIANTVNQLGGGQNIISCQ